MTTVRLRENEPFEVALRRFKRTCEKAGVLADTRKKEFYEKPTQERKRKAAAADQVDRLRRLEARAAGQAHQVLEQHIEGGLRRAAHRRPGCAPPPRPRSAPAALH